MRYSSTDRNEPLTKDQRLELATVLVCAFLVMLTAATCGACAAAVNREETAIGRTPVAQYVSAVAIRATCDLPDGTRLDMPIGTGVAVSRTLVLTAHHVISPDVGTDVPLGTACRFTVVDGDQTLHPVVIDVDLPDVDVARLRLSAPGDELAVAGKYPVRIGPRPEVGDLVCAIGLVPTVTRFCGVEQWHDSKEGEAHDIEHSIFTMPGNSGGPIYDSLGRLVGLTTKFMRCRGEVCGGKGTSLSTRQWLVPRSR